MITITGMVINVDNGQLAEGVEVGILDTGYRSAAPTAADGLFQIEIPRGTTLYITTDDPVGDTGPDDWFPLINVEMPLPTADDNIAGLIIHACPETSGEAQGSVAIWDDYLQNKDAANGDLFVPTSSAASAGIVTTLFWACEYVQPDSAFYPSTADLSMEIEDPMWPVAYAKNSCTFAIGNAVQSQPIVYDEPAVTDESGWVMSFGDPAFTGDTVRLNFFDRRPERSWAFAQPVDVPVRPGVITLVWALILDGRENASVNDFIPCAVAFEADPPG